MVPSDRLWIDTTTARTLPAVPISLAEKPDPRNVSRRRQGISQKPSGASDPYSLRGITKKQANRPHAKRLFKTELRKPTSSGIDSGCKWSS